MTTMQHDPYRSESIYIYTDDDERSGPSIIPSVEELPSVDDLVAIRKKNTLLQQKLKPKTMVGVDGGEKPNDEL